MKNLFDFLKRYYLCIFDFKLFKKYLNEPIIKAVLFLLPLFIVFTTQTYLGSVKVPNMVLDSLDYYYDHVNTIQYSDITSDTGDYNMSDTINLAFENGALVLPQTKIYDQTFTQGDKKYRLILDTINSKGVTFSNKNDYDKDTKTKLGFNSAYMVIYVNKNFVVINTDELLFTYDISQFDEKRSDTLGIYKFVKENYLSSGTYLVFSLMVTSFLYLMYYVVIYIIAKTTTKRQGYKLTKGRLVRVCLYSMQSGMYAYFLLNLISKLTDLNIQFVIPLLSMIAMAYVATKSLDQLKDYVKREDRKVKKASKKAKLQDS